MLTRAGSCLEKECGSRVAVVVVVVVVSDAATASKWIDKASPLLFSSGSLRGKILPIDNGADHVLRLAILQLGGALGSSDTLLVS